MLLVFAVIVIVVLLILTGKTEEQKKVEIKNQFLSTVRELKVGDTPFWWTVDGLESFKHAQMLDRVNKLEFSLTERLRVSGSRHSFPIAEICSFKMMIFNAWTLMHNLQIRLKEMNVPKGNITWTVKQGTSVPIKYTHQIFLNCFLETPDWEWTECRMCESSRGIILADLNSQFASLWQIVQRRQHVSEFLERACLDCPSYRYQVGRRQLSASEILGQLKSDKVSSRTKVVVSKDTRLELWQLGTKIGTFHHRWKTYNKIHKFLEMNCRTGENEKWRLGFFNSNEYTFAGLLEEFLAGGISINQKLSRNRGSKKYRLNELPRSTISFLKYCLGDFKGEVFQKDLDKGNMEFFNYIHPDIEMSVGEYLLQRGDKTALMHFFEVAFQWYGGGKLTFKKKNKSIIMSEILKQMQCVRTSEEAYTLAELSMIVDVLSEMGHVPTFYEAIESDPFLIGSDESLFVTAVKTKNVDLMQKLLGKTGRVEKYDSKGVHALNIAVHGGSFDVLKILLEHGVGLDEIVELEDSPLGVALENRNLEAFKALMRFPSVSGTNPKLLNALMMKAIELKSGIEFLNLLWSEQKDSGFKSHGEPLLHVCVRYRYGEGLLYFWDLIDNKNVRNLEGQTPFHLSLEEKWTEGSTMFIEKGVNVSVEDMRGQTPLHIATRTRNFEIMKQLLQTGNVALNAKDLQGNTPIHIACLEQAPQEVRLLLDHGAQYEVESADGRNAVDIAMEDGTGLTLVPFLEICDMNMGEIRFSGQNLLTWAISIGEKSLLKTMLKKQPEHVNSPDGRGLRPLDIALANQNNELIMVLLESGAVLENLSDAKLAGYFEAMLNEGDKLFVEGLVKRHLNMEQAPNTQKRLARWSLAKLDFQFLNLVVPNIIKLAHLRVNGETVLTYAIKKDAYDEFCKYFDLVFFVNIPNSRGKYPVHLAIDTKDENLLQLLLSNDAKLDILTKDGIGLTSYVMNKGNESLMKCLLASGLNVSGLDSTGRNVYTWAISQGYAALALQMLSSGIPLCCDGNALHPVNAAYQKDQVEFVLEALVADSSLIDLATGTCASLLNQAARDGKTELVRKLVSAGCSLNLTGGEDPGALFWAMENEDVEMVTLLLDFGATSKVVDGSGNSILSWSLIHNVFGEVSAFANATEIDLNRRNINGETALHLAIQLGELNAVQRLIEWNCDPSIAPTRDISAIDLAIQKGHYEIAALLIGKGILPKQQDNFAGLISWSIEQRNAEIFDQITRSDEWKGQLSSNLSELVAEIIESKELGWLQRLWTSKVFPKTSDDLTIVDWFRLCLVGDWDEGAQYLLESDDNQELCSGFDGNGESAFGYAKKQGDPRIVQMFISRYLSLSPSKLMAIPPVVIEDVMNEALELKDFRSVTSLLEKGVGIGKKDVREFIPFVDVDIVLKLIQAMTEEHLKEDAQNILCEVAGSKSLKFLEPIYTIVDQYVSDDDGMRSPLAEAVRTGRLKNVKFLLDEGWSADRENEEDERAMDLVDEAPRRCRQLLAELLGERYGVDNQEIDIFSGFSIE